MSDELQIQPLLNVVNEETRNKIIDLDKRLKILRTEVDVKLMDVALYRGPNPEDYKKGLLTMQHELSAALDSISTLVNTVVLPGQENNPIFSGELMDELSSSIERFNFNKMD